MATDPTLGTHPLTVGYFVYTLLNIAYSVQSLHVLPCIVIVQVLHV